MTNRKVVHIYDRMPKLKEQRRQKANRRLIFFLSIFFFLIMIIIYFESPLSHVRSIEVIGNETVPKELIIEKSGISQQTNLWTISEETVVANIKELDQVQSVQLKRKFPNDVEITIEEYRRIAYLFSEGKYYPIIETGKFLDELSRNEYPVDAPILINWEEGDVIEELAFELTKLPNGILNRISEIYYEPVEHDPYQILLYMNDGNKVYSTVRDFSSRISSYPSIVSELDPNKKGIIHMRMTPYFEEIVEPEEEKDESQG